MNKIILVSLIIMTTIIAGCGSNTSTDTNNTGTSGQTQTTEDPNQTSTYQNKEFKFTLDFPMNRTFKENVYGSKVMFFLPQIKGDATRENIGFSIQKLATGTDLEAIYLNNKKMLESITSNLNVKSEDDATIDNIKAKKIVYQFSQDKYEIRQLQYIFIKDQNLYIITYIGLKDSFNDYIQQVDKMINTLKFY